MSADNWGKCPRCKAAAPVYGKATEQEYKAYMAKHERNSTLREDYEIYTGSNGVFSVRYSCSCAQCGLAFNFKHLEKLK
jgi:hypothetical protein